MILFYAMGLMIFSAILAMVIGLPIVFFFYISALSIGLLFFGDKLFLSITNLAMLIALLTKQTFKSYGDLETVADEFTLVRKDGSLATVIRLNGCREIIGGPEEAKMILEFQSMMKNQMMKNVGLDIQFVYTQSPGDSGVVAEKVMAPFRATAKRIGLDIEDLLQAETDVVAKESVKEGVLIVVNTHPAALGRELKDAYKRRSEKLLNEAKALLSVKGDFSLSQNPMVAIDNLFTLHDAFLNSILTTLEQCKLSAKKIPAEEFLIELKREINGKTSSGWRPIIPRTSDTKTRSSDYAKEIANPIIGFPALWRQLFDEDFEEEAKSGHVIANGLHYASVVAELPPNYDNAKNFNNFLNGNNSMREIPFRVSTRIYSKGLDMRKFDSMMVGMLSLTKNGVNRRIKNAMNELKSREVKEDPTMAMSIIITTWHKNPEVVDSYRQNILSNLQGWGGFDASVQTGDAIELYASSLPAYSSSLGGRAMLVESTLAAKLLPMGRPVSVWSAGAVLLTSLDKKLLPYQPGSSMQDFWVNGFFAPPGSGKSVMLLTIELAQCLAPGLNRLPLIAHIDVGESVSGLISLLQSALPANRKYEAGFFKIKLDKDYSVNVFDTRLGLRFPLPIESAFLKSFLTLICTPAGKFKPYDSVYEVMGLAIDELYKIKSIDKTANKYESSISVIVDEAIKTHGIKVDKFTTWYELVDIFFQMNLITEAEMANRYAAPLLSDLSAVLNSNAIKSSYGSVTIEGADGEKLIDFCSRMISSTIRDYPIFSRPTIWDLRNCRVIGIDLNDVRGQGDSGAKQTALMYMFAHNAATRNFYVHVDDLKFTPALYQDYWRKQAEDVAAEIKTITYDELHNTTTTNPDTGVKVGIASLWRVLEQVAREGRKFGIALNLASQQIEDLGSLASVMSGFFIMKAGTAINQRQIQNTMELSDTAMHLLDKHVKRPGLFMASFETKEGTSLQIFRNHLSPIKAWAFSTVAENKLIRSLLYDKMPSSEARKILAKRFPKPDSFKIFIEQKKANMNDSSEDGGADIIKNLAAEMYLDWSNSPQKAKND